jgi:hypothetical protein
VTNQDDADTAQLNQSVISNLAAGSFADVILTVASSQLGNYTVLVTAASQTNSSINYTISITTEILAEPAINLTSITPYAVINGSNINLLVSALNSQGVWAQIVKPDSNTENVSLTNNANTTFSNTTLIGRYNVTFYVNDSLGNIANTTDYFETFEGVNFNFSIINFNSSGVNSSFEIEYRDMVVISNSSSTGNYTDAIPNTIVNIDIKSYANRLQILLREINLSLENAKTFGMDKLSTPASGYLATYGINNSYNFTNATVKIYYDDLSVSDESNLQLYKCNNYNFTGRTCLGSWADISSSSSQNVSADYFEYNTANFSGFSIKQYVVPAAEETVLSSGGSGSCVTNWVCSGWSACINSEQIRNCEKEIVYCFADEKPEEIRSCEELPGELFDVTFNLEESVIDDVYSLSSVVTFESFGTIPTPVDLTFIILDEMGNEVYRKSGEIVVTTEEVLRWDYEGLKLGSGKYAAILKTLYDVNTEDEFRVDFEIKKKKEITERVIDWTFDGGKWWLGGVIGIGLIIWLIWWLLRFFNLIGGLKK